MTPSLDSRQSAALAAALDRVVLVTAQAAERAAETLALKSSAATNVFQREALNSAQFELRQKMATFNETFSNALRRNLARDATLRGDSKHGQGTDWQSLSLVDDHEVEALVGADRLGQAIAADCEWELRDVDAFMGALLRFNQAARERNPLRPETIGKALFAAVEAVSQESETRKVISEELTRLLAQGMRACYASIVEDFRQRGVQPLALAVKQVEGRGNDGGRTTSGNGAFSSSHGHSAAGDLASSGDSGAMSLGSGRPGFGRSSGGMAGSGGGPAGHGGAGGPGGLGGAGTGGPSAGTPIGHVDGEMMSLLRRLVWMSSTGSDAATALGGADHGDTPSGSGQLAAGVPHGMGMPIAPNLIVAHRDALKQASTGALDHMVIDVVGSLFDQILSDAKVPPQMARQIARLQLPVLRAALGDPTFFSSRRHPVRRFVNRIASLACAFDDFDEDPGKEFLGLVRELVQEIVNGDFDQIEVYEGRLARLEAFIADQTQKDVQEHGDAAALFGQKEDQLRQQQRYMRQLKTSLEPVGLPEFMRDFLSQVWSQAIVAASRRDGEGGDLPQRLRRVGRDLVMSVQPKGSPAERKDFLVQLPQLMKSLNEGMALIGWPEDAQKTFFAELLPAHAESLKGRSMSPLERNLLVKQLDAILGAPLPSLDDPQTRSSPIPQIDESIAEKALITAEEAQRIGLVTEASVNWDGQIDIDLSAEEPEVRTVDIDIDGLPPPEPMEPTRGSSLIDHLQIGFAYRLHRDEGWQKVRLSHISQGRTFFVFTQGKKHQQILSMTLRMVSRLCETGRLRTFENAYLLERATARARAQLAALGAPAPAARVH